MSQTNNKFRNKLLLTIINLNSHAIRMNILCNSTGKKGAFRAIDWLVEHNNLYIKVSWFLSCCMLIGSDLRLAYIWRKVLEPPERAHYN